MYIHTTVSSQVRIKDVLGMNILGGASVHIKAIGSTPIPHQNKNSSRGIRGQYALSMLGIVLYNIRDSSVHILLILCTDSSSETFWTGCCFAQHNIHKGKGQTDSLVLDET